MSIEDHPSTHVSAEPRSSGEWRGWLLIPTVYGTWMFAAFAWSALGAVAGTALLTLATCWFMSLQHELIHGHPSRSQRVNRLFGLAPLAVWYPYELYQTSHLAHHRDELLTEPGIDPESNYIAEADYLRLRASGPCGSRRERSSAESCSARSWSSRRPGTTSFEDRFAATSRSADRGRCIWCCSVPCSGRSTAGRASARCAMC